MDKWDEDRAKGVTEAFHAAAAEAKLWSAALQKLADTFKADGCVLVGGPSSSIEPICSPSLQQRINEVMPRGWVEDNLFLERSLIAFELGHDFVTEATIFSSSEIDHHQSFSKFVNQLKPRWFVATILAGAGPSSIILKLVRRAEAKPFSSPEIEALGQIRPHLREAGNFALRLAAVHHDGVLGAFDTFERGAVLLDQKGRVLCANTKAKVLMREALTIRDGFLRAETSESDAALQKLIRSVLMQRIDLAAEPWGVVAVLRPAASPLLIQSAPLPVSADDQFWRARCVLTIVDPDASRLPDLRTIFGLTSSEAAITGEIALGRNLDDIAAKRQVTIGTVRAQLKSILFKTGTKRQSELVALILRYSRFRE